MTCRDFLDRISEANTLPADAAGHMRACTACRRAAEPWLHLQEGLRALASEWGSIEAPPRVKSALLAEFHSHRGITRHGNSWTGVFALAAAAAVILALGAVLLQSSHIAPRSHSVSGTELAIAQPAETDADPQSGFIPLPNTGQIDANEETDVVRVELPRSVMFELGYSVSADRAEETVQADVMLGSDGVARAVRFLDEF
jgi:hypothetical protein